MRIRITPERRQWLMLVAIPIVTLFGTGVATLHNGYLGYHRGDLRYYYHASTALLKGMTPYRDFEFAYPPLSLVPFLLPHLAALFGLSGFAGYIRAFLSESCLWSLGIVLLLSRLTSRWKFPLSQEIALGCYAALVLIFSALLPWRYDLFPALLTLAAFYSLLKEKPCAAGVWLGLGVAAKLYPVVLLPVFGLYLYTLGRRKDFMRLMIGSISAVTFSLLPFMRIPLSTLMSFLTFHERRGLEVESLGAGVLMIAHHYGWTNAKIVTNYGACNLSSASAPALIHSLPLIFIILLSVTLVGSWRAFRQDITRCGHIEPETLARFTMAALLAFIAANKVFSTSYVIWLLPFAPLLRPREAIQMLILFAVTIMIYPFNFGELLNFHPFGIWLLNLRNLFLLILFFQLARPIRNYQILPERVQATQRLANVL